MRKLIVFTWVGMLFAGGVSLAGINSHEVGSFLVYPYWNVKPFVPPGGGTVPLVTALTITNDSGMKGYNVHMALINGEDSDGNGIQDCNECSWDQPLTPFDTDLLVLLDDGAGGVNIFKVNQGGGATLVRNCAFQKGFAIAFVEDASLVPRQTVGDSVLHGDLIASFDFLSAWSTSAIAIQGTGVNDGDRIFEFNDVEYAAFPDILTTNYLTASQPFLPPGLKLGANAILFNLNYTTYTGPPTTNCPVNVYDSEENNFNESFNFNCWTIQDLPDPLPGIETNAYFWTDCDPGTHGLIFQEVFDPTAPNPAPPFLEWGRPLFQSRTRDADTIFQTVPAP